MNKTPSEVRAEQATILFNQMSELVNGLPWPVAEAALTSLMGQLITNLPAERQQIGLDMTCAHVRDCYRQMALLAADCGEKVH